MDTLIRQGRIVGLKYAKMKKQYHNNLFPFHQDGIPSHVLITLINMGGKGVLLQAFFQLIEPLIRWGKEEKMVDSFFFKEKKIFSPYTFHVLIEWAVGREPHTKILTGIAVTASPRSSQKVGNESPIEPEYLLYILEQTENAPFDISSIELWNDEAKTSLAMEDLKKYLKGHESHVSTYTKNQRREYFNELKKYGIDLHEMRVLKSINKDEGDVSAYFGKAEDNHTLASKVIIPTLDKQIEPEYKKTYGEAKSLSETFKEVAIANQEMPKLLKRENTYRILLDELNPLVSFLKNCAVLEQKQLEHRKKGYIIREYMKAKLAEKIEKDTDIDTLLKQNEQSLKRLVWESYNLRYAKAYRNVVETNNQIEHINIKIKSLEHSQRREEEFTKENEVNLLLLERAKLLNDIKQKRTRYDSLKKMMNLDDLEGEMEKFTENLKNDWVSIRESWIGIREQHILFTNKLEEDLNEYKGSLSVQNDNISLLNRKIIEIETLIAEHEKQKIDIEDLYGDIITEDPENFKNIYEYKLKTKEKEEKNIQEKLIQSEQLQKKLLDRKGETQSQIQILEKQKNDIEEKLNFRILEETNIMNEISNIFKERIDTYSVEAILSATKRLEQEFTILQVTYDSKLKERWKFKSQYDLLKNLNYWVPNKELLEVKNEITSQRIKCELGMEILYQLLENVGEEVARKEIEKTPLLPYGVVVSSDDIENIDFTFLEKKYHQSPVPIFIREYMNKNNAFKQENERLYMVQDDMFITVDAWLYKALDLYEFSKKKQEIDKKGDDLDFQIDNAKKHLIKVLKLLYTCETFLQQTDSSFLQQRKEEIEKELDIFRTSWSAIEEELTASSMEMNLNKNRLNIIYNEMNNYKEKLKDVKQWMSEVQKRNRLSFLLKDFLQNYDEEVEKKESLVRIIENKEKELSSYRDTYKDWKRNTEDPYKRLTSILGWITNPLEQQFEYPYISKKVEEPDYSSESIDLLKNRLFEHHNLKTSIETKNLELTRITLKIESLSEQLSVIHSNLSVLNSNWESIQVPKSSTTVITQTLNFHKDNIRELQNKIKDLNDNTLILIGSLKRDKILLETEKEKVVKQNLWEPVAWIEMNLDEKEKEIKRSRHKLNNERQELDEKHKKIQKELQSLNSSITQLDNFDLLEVNYDDFSSIEWLDGIKENYEGRTKSWTTEYLFKEKELKSSSTQFRVLYENYRDTVGDSKDLNKEILFRVETYFEDIKSQEYNHMYEGVQSILISFQEELKRIKEDKIQGLGIIKQWTNRATYRVNLIVKKMKQMVSRMKIKNYNDYSFPLVKYADKYQFNENFDHYETVLTEFFIKILANLKETGKDIQDIPLYEIDKMIDISILVLKVLGNQYPTIEIYNPGGDNHLLYGKPNDSLYSDWETIMKGDYAEASGSGGQKLMTQMIIMAMLMKSNKKGWSVLISDNPFSKMVSEHVIAPIFALCELLKIQWVVVSPPELTSTVELTKRFPVIHRLSFNREKGKDIINHSIQMNSRIYIDKENILNERKISSE